MSKNNSEEPEMVTMDAERSLELSHSGMRWGGRVYSSYFCHPLPSSLEKSKTTGTSFSTQTTISSVGIWTREMSVWTIHIDHLKRLAGLGSINHTNLNPGYTLLINNSCLLSKAAWNIVRYIIPIMFYMLSLSNGNMKMLYFQKV